MGRIEGRLRRMPEGQLTANRDSWFRRMEELTEEEWLKAGRVDLARVRQIRVQTQKAESRSIYVGHPQMDRTTVFLLAFVRAACRDMLNYLHATDHPPIEAEVYESARLVEAILKKTEDAKNLRRIVVGLKKRLQNEQ